MEYLDFELAIGTGDGHTYPVSVIRSPAGEQRATTEFPFDELELKNKLQGLQIALLKSGATRRDVVQPEEKASIEDFGKALFGTLFPEEIRSCYRMSRQRALQEGKGLRLRLRIEAPELASMPWEYLYDESEGDFVCLSTDTPIVRYLELDRPPEPLTFTPPMRILGMVASPEDRAKLDVSREKQRISEALADLEARGLVSMTWMEGATWQELQKAMRQGPWHVFHFVGHGGFDATSGEGMLALCDENNQTFRLSAVKLGRLLADHRDLRLVVLNACEGAQGSDTDIFSSTASVLIRRGVPAVIAMQFEITDRAAIQFVHVFVESLAEGLPIDAAVSEARKAISLSTSNTVEWGTPVLHMRSPDGLLFVLDPDAPPIEAPAYPKHVGQAPRMPLKETAGSEVGPSRSTRSASRLTSLTGNKAALAGIAGVVVAALALLVWWIWPAGGDAATDGVRFSSIDQIASIALFADADDIAQDSFTVMRAVALDSEGRRIRTEDLVERYPLIWDPGDSTVVRIIPGENSYSIRVQGLRGGEALVCVAFADSTENMGRLVGKHLISVHTDDGGRARVYREYSLAQDAFANPNMSDAEVLSSYRRLLDQGGAVGVLESEQLALLERRIGQLEGLTTQYDDVDDTDRANTVSIVEERTLWEDFVAAADSVRDSTARTRAIAMVDSLKAIEAEYVTLQSLELCLTGGLDCPERSRTNTFAVGQRAYFSAKVNLAGAIRWEWHGPDGSVVDGGSESLPTAGYRTYKSLSDTEGLGSYELRVYNGANHLIGRRSFTVGAGG